MSWYKKAKVIDAVPDNPTRSVYFICYNCGRWATNDSGSRLDNFDWKYYYQMDPEEQSIVDESKNKDYHGSHSFATTICDICKKRKR